MSLNPTRYYFGMAPSVQDKVSRKARSLPLPYAVVWELYVRAQKSGLKLPVIPQSFAEDFLTGLFVFDLFGAWLDWLSLMSAKNLMRKKGTPFSTQAATLGSLTSRVASDFEAVRLLILRGFDTQARQIARAVSEDLDALGLAAISVAFCEDFIRLQDPLETKQVWDRYIARGKARSEIFAAVEPLAGRAFVEQSQEYRKNEMAVFSAAVHPSHIAGFMTLLRKHSTERRGADGVVDGASVRTLSYCNRLAFEFSVFDQLSLGVSDHIMKWVSPRTRVPFARDTMDVCQKMRALSQVAYLSALPSEEYEVASKLL